MVLAPVPPHTMTRDAAAHIFRGKGTRAVSLHTGDRGAPTCTAKGLKQRGHGINCRRLSAISQKDMKMPTPPSDPRQEFHRLSWLLIHPENEGRVDTPEKALRCEGA